MTKHIRERHIKKSRIDMSQLAVYLLIFTISSKWLFEFILDLPIIEVAFLACGAALLFAVSFHERIYFNLNALIWLLYCVVIFSSVVTHNSRIGIWSRCIMTILIVIYALLLNTDNVDEKKIGKLIVIIASFFAVFVILQFLLKEKFNNIVFQFFTEEAQLYADSYFRGLRYYGIMPSPHEVAGITLYAIVILFLSKNVNKFSRLFLVAFLTFSLVLNGKKGIILCAILTTIILFILRNCSPKKFWKVLIFLLIMPLVAFGAIYYIMNHSDVLILKRFADFFNGIANNNVDTSSRTEIFNYAISMWKSTPMFGIGWRQFNAYSTSQFNFNLAHEINCDYLQWWCELGVVGFVFVMIPLLITLFRAFVVCKKEIIRTNNSSPSKVVVFAVFVHFFTLLYAFIEIPFFDNLFFGFYILSCVIINATYKKYSSSKRIRFALWKTERLHS